MHVRGSIWWFSALCIHHLSKNYWLLLVEPYIYTCLCFVGAQKWLYVSLSSSLQLQSSDCPLTPFLLHKQDVDPKSLCSAHKQSPPVHARGGCRDSCLDDYLSCSQNLCCSLEISTTRAWFKFVSESEWAYQLSAQGMLACMNICNYIPTINSQRNYRIAGNIGGPLIWRFGPKPSEKNIGGIWI